MQKLITLWLVCVKTTDDGSGQVCSSLKVSQYYKYCGALYFKLSNTMYFMPHNASPELHSAQGPDLLYTS